MINEAPPCNFEVNLCISSFAEIVDISLVKNNKYNV